MVIECNFVSEVTGYQLDDRSSIRCKGMNSLLASIYTSGLGQVEGLPDALPPGVKQLEREVYLSSPSSNYVNNAWSYTSTPPYAFKAYCLGMRESLHFELLRLV
jgi:hypothetical protein